MSRPFHLAPLLFGLLSVGCGGLTPCGGDDFGSGNRESAGSYIGTYVNTEAVGTSGAAKNLDIQLSITDDLTVSGTVTEPTTGRTATVSGHLTDWHPACASDTTYFDLSFTFDGESERTLSATKSYKPFTVFKSSAQYRKALDEMGDPLIGKGKLELTKQ